MTTPAGIYPFATQDGKAIPLDIIKPEGILLQTFGVGSSSSFTLPEGSLVGTFTATSACLVRFGTDLPGSLAADTLYAETLLIPAETTVTCALTAGLVYVIGLVEEGTIYVQLIKKWAGLALDRQYLRK